jgi:hypothetical protein
MSGGEWEAPDYPARTMREGDAHPIWPHWKVIKVVHSSAHPDLISYRWQRDDGLLGSWMGWRNASQGLPTQGGFRSEIGPDLDLWVKDKHNPYSEIAMIPLRPGLPVVVSYRNEASKEVVRHKATVLQTDGKPDPEWSVYVHDAPAHDDVWHCHKVGGEWERISARPQPDSLKFLMELDYEDSLGFAYALQLLGDSLLDSALFGVPQRWMTQQTTPQDISLVKLAIGHKFLRPKAS